MRAIPVVVTLAALSLGCGASVQESFRETGYYHPDYPYRVEYVEGSGGQLMPEGWRLDNVQVRDGRLQDYKDGEEYVHRAEFDTDDDGTTDFDIDLYTYDLLFEHRRHDGRIWLRTLPVSRHLEEKSLEVLAENYVENVAGTGFIVSRLDHVLLEERRYGTRTTDSGSGEVAGSPAHRITFDVVNLDQLEADPDTVPMRVRLYLIRPPFQWTPRASVAVGGAYPRGEWPLIMIAGYANDANRFEAEEETLDGFVSRLAILRPGGSITSGLDGFEPLVGAEPTAPPEPAPPQPAAAETTDGPEPGDAQDAETESAEGMDATGTTDNGSAEAAEPSQPGAGPGDR